LSWGAAVSAACSLPRYLEQSDVFVGLYWESYGWVAPGEEVSGLEDEYRLSGDRPKLIYIKAPAPNRQPRLTEMIPEGEDRRIMALAQLLQAIARGTGSDHGRWRDPVTEASRRLEAEGEPLAVSFGLVAGAVLARIHGRMDEARLLAQQAHDISTRMGDSYVRVYASTQLARAALGLGDVVAARSSAVEALLVARRLRNPSQMGYALELWATAELRDGRIERAGQLYALGERGTRLVSDRVWPTDAQEHLQLDGELRAALGDRYEQALAQTRTIDLDRAVAELVESDPVAQRLSDSRDAPTGAT
jgi:ATP/maltotriose-dependent transcriptional regulator MalT